MPDPSRNSVEPEAGVIIVVWSQAELTRRFEDEIAGVVRQARGDQTPVQLFALRSALEAPSEPGKSPNTALE